MAAVQQIQQNIKVGALNIRATFRVSNLHHKEFITWKRDIVRIQEKWNNKAESMYLGPSSILHDLKASCYVTGSRYGSKEWLFHQYWLLLRHHNCAGNFKRGWQLRSTILFVDL